jgi:hypothetical protein
MREKFLKEFLVYLVVCIALAGTGGFIGYKIGYKNGVIAGYAAAESVCIEPTLYEQDPVLWEKYLKLKAGRGQ